MKKTLTFFAAAAAILLSGCACFNCVSDNFSGRDWKVKENTVNGKISYCDDGLKLFNHISLPGYCAAYKDFEIDFDATPFFSVELTGEVVNGLVRLQFEGKPRQEILQYRANGVYAVNVAEKLKVSGVHKVRVLLYNLSANRYATFKKICFSADKPETYVVTPKVKRSRVVPSFNSASYYVSMPKTDKLQVTFRELPGGKWQDAYQPIRDEEDGNYRGSIVNLKEARDYILRVCDGEKTVFEKKFRTASSIVPVGRTVLLNKNNFNGYLKKIISGTPEAWVRYIAEPGFVLTNDGKSALIEVDRAKYVIFEGLTLKGGDRRAVAVTNSSNIRFINCNVSGWGRKGVQRFDYDGKYFIGDSPINFDGAFDLSSSRNVVIERCFVHDPRGRANSWQFSHPAGPEAVVVYNCTGTVIRYNDFVGSDEHRWNDAVEGGGNFDTNGGLNRDADVNGNFMIFTSDDCIELDGGQQNVRCYGNRFEGGFCGVSIQGCMKGPSYVFDNLLVNMNDEYNLNGLTLKTNSGKSGKYAKSFIFHNTFAGTGGGTVTLSHLPIEFYNNIFTDENSLYLGKYPWTNDNNLLSSAEKTHGKNTVVSKNAGFTAPELGNYSPAANSPALNKAKKLNNFSRGTTIGAMQSDSCAEQLPRRPIPAKTDVTTLNFGRGELSKHFTLIARDDAAFRKGFTIAKTEAADWFEVTPASGILHTGQTITFEVKLKKERLSEREIWKGAFLIRFEDGLSRPIAVYAKSEPINIADNIKKYGAAVTFIEAENPVSGAPHTVISDANAGHGKALDFRAVNYNSYPAAPTDPKRINVYEFTVPKDGIYTIALRIRADEPFGMHDSLYASIDSEKLTRFDLGDHIQKEWHWCVPSGLSKNRSTFGAFRLKAGKHTLRIAPREQMFIDTIAVSDDIRAFLNW